MRILYLTQYFNLPHEAGGSRHYQFAKAWARAGHEVSILCGHVNYKTGQVVQPDRGKTYSIEHHPDGFEILKIWVFHRFQGSFKKRLLYFATYAGHASILGSTLPRPDVVFASSTPLTVGLPGLLLARRFRVPFVFECRDIWPEAAVAAGVLKNQRFIRGAQSLAAYLYRHADRISTVTDRMKGAIMRYGIPDEKVTVVPNGVDDWMRPERYRDRNPLARFEGRRVCLYVGAHGVWNYLGTKLDAAEILKDRTDLVFVFIGDGDQKTRLEQDARRRGLANVAFLGAMPKEDAFAAMVHADLGLIASNASAAYAQILPNKIFDYAAAELPMVVAAAEGEMADFIQKSGGGWVTPPEDGAALAGLIRRVLDLPEAERRAAGARGRAYVREHYDRPSLAGRLLEVFEGARGTRPPAAGAEAVRTVTSIRKQS